MEPCINEIKDLSVPKIVLNGIIFTTSIYLFHQAYYKQKWDKDIKIEYTCFVIISVFCMKYIFIKNKKNKIKFINIYKNEELKQIIL